MLIRKNGEYSIERRPCGGSAIDFELRHKYTKEEMFGRTRVFAEIVFEPGDLLPMHEHVNDVEIYVMKEGELVVTDKDGVESPFLPGDYAVTGGGGGHSVRNDSGEKAILLAIVVE